MKLHRIASRVYDTPLAIHPTKLAVIEAFLGPRLGMQAATAESPEMFAAPAEKREMSSMQPGGICVIDISGTLVNRAGGMDAWSGMASYSEISEDLARAVANPEVKGILLRVESPGGEAIGLAGVGQAVRAAAAVKPVWCSIDAYAFSAAYWIASAADQIYIPQDGEAGSIGTIARHVDQSKYNEAEGFKVTSVFFGSQKNDFTPHEPLSDAAFERLKADVNTLGGMFVDAVAKNRGLAKSAVRLMEAGTFIGQQAVAAGLADTVGTYADCLKAFAESIATGKSAAPPAVIVPRSISDAEKRGAAVGIERRHYAAGDLRSEVGSEPCIKGHMAVFDRWSSDVGGFIEIVKPGAFTKTLKDGGDIHDYFNHDSNFVLGRVKSGTLRLSEDETGLYSENDPPDTQTVRDLVLAPIDRGDIDQGSIAFRAVRQEWGRVDGELTRTLHEVRLYHVSPVPRGAYETTSLGLRGSEALGNELDFLAIQIAMAKQDQGLPLTERDREVLTQSIKTIESYLSVAPGLAVHPTGRTVEPPIDMAALHTRLRRAKALMLRAV